MGLANALSYIITTSGKGYVSSPLSNIRRPQIENLWIQREICVFLKDLYVDTLLEESLLKVSSCVWHLEFIKSPIVWYLVRKNSYLGQTKILTSQYINLYITLTSYLSASFSLCVSILKTQQSFYQRLRFNTRYCYVQWKFHLDPKLLTGHFLFISLFFYAKVTWNSIIHPPLWKQPMLAERKVVCCTRTIILSWMNM